MVNMARGLGTALGVATVTLALHAAGRLDHASSGPAAAMVVLTAAALVATWAGRYDGTARRAGARGHLAGHR
jgi:hypothetical protein